MPKPANSLAAALALGLTLAHSTTPAFAQEQSASATTEKRTIMPESEGGRAFMEEFGFSEAVIHGDTVYLSGVIAGPAPDGVTREEAYDRTFQYLGSVLERAGSSWDDVVDMTTYHVDIDASMPALASVKNRYVKAPFPAWTAIDIDRLFAPEGEVEIKITARLSPKPPMVSAPEFLPNTGSSTPFSRAVQVGDTLYLAGQLGLARRGDEDQQNGIEAETRRAMERIGGTLALYGLSHDALFKCTVWLAEISDFAAFNTVYRGFFQEGRYPTRSTMAVKELAAGAQIEIECVAHNPASPAKSLAAAMSRPFVAPEPSSSGEVLSDFRPRIAPLGEGQWVYLQRNRGDVPYRQRVLQLLDNPDGSVTQIAWSLSAPEAFTDAPSQPDVLKSLEPSMLVATFSEGCSQEWRYTVGPEPAWTGVVNPETCVIMSERRGVEIRIGAEAKITPEGMFEAERGFSLEGEQIWGTPEGEYALIMRAG